MQREREAELHNQHLISSLINGPISVCSLWLLLTREPRAEFTLTASFRVSAVWAKNTKRNSLGVKSQSAAGMRPPAVMQWWADWRLISSQTVTDVWSGENHYSEAEQKAWIHLQQFNLKNEQHLPFLRSLDTMRTLKMKMNGTQPASITVFLPPVTSQVWCRTNQSLWKN